MYSGSEDGMGSCTPNSSSGDAGYTYQPYFVLTQVQYICIGCWNIRSFSDPTKQSSRLRADETHDRMYGVSTKEHC